MLKLLSGITALLVASGSVYANEAEYDAAMLNLAKQSGCMSCHSILPAPKRLDGLPPIAPAWRDIAIMYRDDPDASNRLTRIVMNGSDPRSAHWAGKVSHITMPPNGVAVTQSDARMLVNWILVLVP